MPVRYASSSQMTEQVTSPMTLIFVSNFLTDENIQVQLNEQNRLASSAKSVSHNGTLSESRCQRQGAIKIRKQNLIKCGIRALRRYLKAEFIKYIGKKYYKMQLWAYIQALVRYSDLIGHLIGVDDDIFPIIASLINSNRAKEAIACHYKGTLENVESK